MRLSVCIQALYHLPFETALKTAAELGFAGIELPVDAGSPFVDLEELLAGGSKRLARELAARELELSAISNHQEGQLLLGPHHADTDTLHAGSAEEKRAYAERRLLASARLAADLGIGVVVGFAGCEDWSRFFPWPDPRGWEKMIPTVQDRLGRLLDAFDRLGVALALEPHPKQMVYNIETAHEILKVMNGHPRLGFNFDPANLMLAGVDPVLFASELASRILHVHAKDGELVAHLAARSGLLAHGAWDRPGRGFRFRIPGWGDLSWKRLISELRLGGYDGWLAVENEDPVFEPVDGLRKAVQELRPLLPEGPRRARWW